MLNVRPIFCLKNFDIFDRHSKRLFSANVKVFIVPFVLIYAKYLYV